MKPKMLLTLASILSMLVLFSACTKETTTGPGGDPTQAATKAAQGHDILIPKIILLVNSGGTDTTIFDFSSAAALYTEAIGLDPSNADAHFGLAIIDLLSLGGDPVIRNLASGQMGSFQPVFIESLMNPSSGTAGIFTQYGTVLRDRFAGSLNRQINLALGKGTLAGNPISYYQDILETAILSKLISAISHLNVTLANPAYALLITPAMTGGNTTEIYRIDATEINLLRALLQFITADISALVAYNFDYDPSDSAGVYAAWQPSSPFLAFRPNGSQRMKYVRSNFMGAATSIQGSLNYLMNEPPNPETDLINYNPADFDTFTEIIAIMDSVKDYLTGSFTIPAGPTVNFQNFFDDAIPNYKQMIPPYTVSVQESLTPGAYEAVLTFTAATFNDWIFPDPTMRGFFPGMTDADLKVLLDLTVDNWQQSVTIPGTF